MGAQYGSREVGGFEKNTRILGTAASKLTVGRLGTNRTPPWGATRAERAGAS